jgi:hypothetical protein
MRKLRTRLLMGSGAATVVTGISLAVAAHPAAAQGIVINPIIKPLLDFILTLPI